MECFTFSPFSRGLREPAKPLWPQSRGTRLERRPFRGPPALPGKDARPRASHLGSAPAYAGAQGPAVLRSPVPPNGAWLPPRHPPSVPVPRVSTGAVLSRPSTSTCLQRVTAYSPNANRGSTYGLLNQRLWNQTDTHVRALTLPIEGTSERTNHLRAPA